MINKLLITCLQRNKRLIIPGLGAFIRKNVDGVGVILVFVPFLNKDDGVLLSALQSWAGVEKEEAEVILKEYIEYIQKSLDNRGQYIIEGVGVLKYDANRVIYLAKESEAVKEESAPKESEPKTVQVPVEEVSLPPVPEESVPQPVFPIDMPAVPEQPRVLKQVIPTLATPENTEAAYEPDPVPAHTPYPSQPPAGAGRNGGIGVRYFSPGKEEPVHVDDNTVSNRPFIGGSRNDQRRNTVNNMYGQGQQPTVNERANVPPQRVANPQQRAANLYGTIPSQAPRQPQASPVSGQVPPRRPLQPGRPPVKGQKKKSSDIVFVIAIVAFVAALLVLIYGWIFGSDNNALQDELLFEENIPAVVDQLQQPATAPKP